jgi:hypothetical protein
MLTQQESGHFGRMVPSTIVHTHSYSALLERHETELTQGTGARTRDGSDQNDELLMNQLQFSLGDRSSESPSPSKRLWHAQRTFPNITKPFSHSPLDDRGQGGRRGFFS